MIPASPSCQWRPMIFVTLSGAAFAAGSERTIGTAHILVITQDIGVEACGYVEAALVPVA